MPLIDIAAANVTEYHGDMAPAEARLYANVDYRTEDGVFVAKGDPQNAPEFFQRFTASLVGSDIRIAAGTAYSSTDSSRPDATHTLAVFDAEGNHIKTVFTGLRIPPDDASTTWGIIQTYSTGRVMTFPPTYLDSNAILALIAEMEGGGGGSGEIDGGTAGSEFGDEIDGGGA